MKILLALYNNKHIVFFPRNQEERARKVRAEDPRLKNARIKESIMLERDKVIHGNVYDRDVPIGYQMHSDETDFNGLSESVVWHMLKENQLAIVGGTAMMFYRDEAWVVRLKDYPFDDPHTGDDPARSFTRLIQLEGLS